MFVSFRSSSSRMEKGVIGQLNAVRDSQQVERILIANSRTEVREVYAHRLSKTELQDIAARMVRENKPFVVRGAGADWKVVRRWGDPDQLLAQAKLEHEKFPNRKYTAYKPEADGHLNQSHAAPYSYMSFYKFLQTGRRHKLYLLGVPDKSGRGASPFETKKGEAQPPIFAEDLDADPGPKLFTDLFRDRLAMKRHVFFNSAYSFTNLHYDTDWNTYLCVLGHRCWTIAHPDHVRILGAANGGASYSTLRPTKGVAGLSGHRLAHLVKFIRVELNAGDVLLVPPTWWHVVEGLTDGFSCGINWFYTFPHIDTRSPLDHGWDWASSRAGLSVKPSMMVGGPVPVATEEEDGPGQPNGASEGMQLCSDENFTALILHELKGIYSTIPNEFMELLPRLDTQKPDHMLARQLVRIAANSCRIDLAPAARFGALCAEIQRILQSREAHVVSTKRKRDVMISSN